LIPAHQPTNLSPAMRTITIIAILAQPLAALPINLLTNGSFEAPLLTTTIGITGPFTLPGWTGLAPSNGGNAGLVVGIDNGLSPADGRQHFTLNGGNPSDAGYLEQTIATTAGAAYELTLAVGRAGGGQSLSLSALLLDGALPITSQTLLPPPNIGYLTHTLSFTASGPLTTLRLADNSGVNSISDLYVDAVSITQSATIPDRPAPLIELGAILLILHFATRRRTC